MREELVRAFAPRFGIPSLKSQSGNGWIELPCVLAPWTHDKGYDSHPSAAIKINNEGKSWYTCQQCHVSVSFANLAFKIYGYTQEASYQQLGYEIDQLELETQAATLPSWEQDETIQVNDERVYLPRSTLGRFQLAYNSRRCRTYLAGRGIRPYTALELGLRYDYSKDRILFPVFDRLGELRGFSGRAIHDNAPIRVKDYFGLDKIELMLGEHRIFANRHRVKFVVVVEGPFDYAKVFQAGLPVLGLFGSKLTQAKFNKLVDLNLPIIWMTDNDEAGYACMYGPKDKTTGQRDPYRGALHMLNDYLPQLIATYPKGKNDPAVCNSLQLKRMVKNAEIYMQAA